MQYSATKIMRKSKNESFNSCEKKGIKLKFNLVIVAATLFGCASTTQLNLMPMYGGVQKSKEQLALDSTFLKTIDAQGLTRDSASKYFSKKGWEFYYQGNSELAMKRFNQSWLLDSTNASAYFGFGSILGRRMSPIDSVIYFMQMAHRYDENDLPINASLAYSFSTKAYQLNANNDQKWLAYRDSALAVYAKILPDLKFESSYGIQYIESLIMMYMKADASKIIASIDTLNLNAQTKARYHFLKSEIDKPK